MRQSLFDENAATWWRSKVKVEETMIVPVEPFIPYNVFDTYFPRNQVARREESLPLVFARVDATDLKAVTGFCERFGMLGPIDQQRFGPSRAVLEKRLGFRSSGGPIGEKLRDYWAKDKQQQLAGEPPDPDYIGPIQLQQFERVQHELVQTLDWAERAENDQNARQALPLQLAKKLNVRPRLAWDVQKGRWATTWEILSLEAAMYLMLQLDLQGGGRIRSCEQCRKWFHGDNEKARFCSSTCQNTAKVRRHRQGLAIKKAAQGTNKH